MHEEDDRFYSLAEAAKEGKVRRQAIFQAIKLGRLKAEKYMVTNKVGRTQPQWIILKKDLQEYRENKHVRERRVFEGQKLFDIEQDKWSVLQASKTLSTMLKRRFPRARLYYLIHKGELKATKRGSAWIINKDSLIKIYEEEVADEPVKFAVC